MPEGFIEIVKIMSALVGRATLSCKKMESLTYIRLMVSRLSSPGVESVLITLEVVNMVTVENPLLEHGVKYLYYLAPVKNLRSILRHGIMTKNVVEARKLDYIDCSDREVQALRREKSLHNYVPLFLNTRNAMTYRYQQSGVDFVILRLLSDLVTDYTCKVSDRIAACREAIIMDLTAKALVTFGVREIITVKNFYANHDLKQRLGAEILVHTDIIDSKWIESVFLAPGRSRIRDLSIKQLYDNAWNLYFYV